ncbi:MAG: PEGA domain-containing protein, partial [Myxococcota bacterium]
MRTLCCWGLVAVFTLAAIDADAARRKRRRRRQVAKGTITLVTTAVEASVYLDGKLWGKTPLKPLKITPGRYRLTVKKLGYLEFEQEIEVAARRITTLRAQLLPYAGVLRVMSTEPGAKVYVDGIERGPAPTRLELRVGEHEVTVKSETREIRKTVLAVAGQEVTVALEAEEVGLDDLALAPLAPTDAPSPEPAPNPDDTLGDLALAPIAADAPATEDDLALVEPPSREST